MTMAVQVNGKVRAQLDIAVDASRETIEAEALANPKVGRFTQGRDIRKVIVVPNKLVNIVIG